jgi:hypothetical protein
MAAELLPLDRLAVACRDRSLQRTGATVRTGFR